MKRIFLLFLCIILMFSMTSVGFAANNTTAKKSDYAGQWGEDVINKWVDKDLVDLKKDGSFLPNREVSKVEFIVLVNKLFGYYVEADSNYDDVSNIQWYAKDTRIAKANGYLDWNKSNTLNPKASMLRQEVFATLATILQLDPTEDLSGINKFPDKAKISEWAVQYVDALASGGFIDGNGDGTLQPKDDITRREVIIMLDRVIGDLIDEAEYYGSPEEDKLDKINGNLTINKPGVYIQNMLVQGNLILAAGIADGNIYLDNVTVKGKVIINGGGESIQINNSDFNGIIVRKVGGKKVNIVSHNTKSTYLSLQSNGELKGDFKNIDVIVATPEDKKATLDGEFKSVKVFSPDSKMDVEEDSKIEQLTVKKEASGTKIDLANKVEVAEVIFDSNAKVTGNGKINKATVNADGVELSKRPNKIDVAKGIKDPKISERYSPATYRPARHSNHNNNNNGNNTKIDVVRSNDSIRNDPGQSGEHQVYSYNHNTKTLTISPNPDNRVPIRDDLGYWLTISIDKPQGYTEGSVQFVEVDNTPNSPGDTLKNDRLSVTFGLTPGKETYNIGITWSDKYKKENILVKLNGVEFEEPGGEPVPNEDQVAPSGFDTVNATNSESSDGQITGANMNNMQYRAVGETTFIDITVGKIANLKAGKYEIRLKAYDGHNPSPITIVTVEANNEQVAPSGFDTVNATNSETNDGQITRENFDNIQYRAVGETGFKEITGDTITNLMAGKYEFRFKDTPGSNPSPVTIVTVKANQEQVAPSGFDTVNATNSETNDGQITGVDRNTMQYRPIGETTFKEITGDTITNLKAGKYEIRLKVAPEFNASPVTIVTVKANQEQVAPSGFDTVNATNSETNDGQITGVDRDTMQYRPIGETTFIEIIGDTITDLFPGDYEIRFKAKPEFNASDVTTINIGIKSLLNQLAPVDLQVVDATTQNNDGQITNVSPMMEYRALGETTFKGVRGDKITDLKAGTYEVRLKVTEEYNPGEIAVVLIKQDQVAPSESGFNTVNATNSETNDGQITGADMNMMQYRAVGETDFTDITEGKITNLMARQYEIRLKAYTGHNPSPVTTVTVEANKEQVAPSESGFNTVNATNSQSYDGQITGADMNKMQYRAVGETTFIDITEGKITNLKAGKYEIRLKAYTGFNASPVTTVTVEANKEQVAPSRSGFNTVNATNSQSYDGQITGANMNKMQYRAIGETDFTDITEGKITNLMARQYEIRLKAYNGHNPSPVTTVTVEANKEQVAPARSGFNTVNATNSQSYDGQITGADMNKMQYRAVGETDFTDITEGKITDLMAGDYQIRLKAYTGFNASPVTTVTVEANKEQVAPSRSGFNTVNATNSQSYDGQITGADMNKMQYRAVGETDFTDITEGKITDLMAGKYQIRLKAYTGFNASPVTTVTVEANKEQVAPSRSGFNTVNATNSASNDGQIKITTDDFDKMQYRAVGETTFEDVTGDTITNLMAGDYEFWFKADTGVNPSPITTVTVEANNEQVAPAGLLRDKDSVTKCPGKPGESQKYTFDPALHTLTISQPDKNFKPENSQPDKKVVLKKFGAFYYLTVCIKAPEGYESENKKVRLNDRDYTLNQKNELEYWFLIDDGNATEILELDWGYPYGKETIKIIVDNLLLEGRTVYDTSEQKLPDFTVEENLTVIQRDENSIKKVYSVVDEDIKPLQFVPDKEKPSDNNILTVGSENPDNKTMIHGDEHKLYIEIPVPKELIDANLSLGSIVINDGKEGQIYWIADNKLTYILPITRPDQISAIDIKWTPDYQKERIIVKLVNIQLYEF